MSATTHKRWPAWIIASIISLAALELSPYLLAPALTGAPFERKALRLALTDTVGTYGEGVGTETVEEYLGDHLLHPYMGFSSVPRKDRNRFGLPGADPLMRRSRDTVNVCITGGSVAMGLLTHSSRTLEARLAQLPGYRGRSFRFTAFALGGFKQPQPLEALSWFLAQGAHYDLVIALDGFNEVVLPWCDNRPFNVHPSYPRHWNMYARKRVDNRVLRSAAEQVQVQARRDRLKQRFGAAPWRWSNAALLVWHTLDARQLRIMQEAEERSRTALAASGTDVQATGPDFPVGDSVAYMQAAADIWQRSARLMHEMVRAQGGRFLLFLQPNQYVAGSKPLSAEEKVLAIENGPFCYRDAVSLGYPLLHERGMALQREGVPFQDLSLLFREETRTMYSDKCCHFNKAGYDRIAERIAQVVGAATP